MALRQNAIASALTVVAPRVAAIRGPEEATPSTPKAAIKKFTVPTVVVPLWSRRTPSAGGQRGAIRGEEMEYGPGDFGIIPPGHDAWVVGDEPYVVIDWQGMDDYAKRKG